MIQMNSRMRKYMGRGFGTRAGKLLSKEFLSQWSLGCTTLGGMDVFLFTNLEGF